MRVPTNAEMVSLEQLVDACGLDEVLVALHVICGDKADHIRANYADNSLAKQWEIAGGVIRHASESTQVRTIS